jgi:hypothetical protein
MIMKLLFSPAELLLETDAKGDHVLQLKGRIIGRFKQPKKAIAEFNKHRRELEKEMPAIDLTAEQKRELLQKAVGDGLVGHNSWLPASRVSAKSRIHHS